MPASVLRQDPNTWKVHKNAIYKNETQQAGHELNIAQPKQINDLALHLILSSFFTV